MLKLFSILQLYFVLMDPDQKLKMFHFTFVKKLKGLRR